MLHFSGLCAVSQQYPFVEKILIAPSFGEAHQLLTNLASSGTSWVNFRASTPGMLTREYLQMNAREIGGHLGLLIR